MFIKKALFSLLVLVSVVLLIPKYSVASGNDTDTITISFLANSGIVISNGEVTIAMDALYEGMRDTRHVDPSTESVTNMKTCESIFSDIDIITISHEHSDHFDANAVRANLECNENAVVLCNEVVGTAMEAYSNYDAIKNRIKVTMPEENSFLSDTIHNVSIKIFRFKHATSMFNSMVNLAFLIDLNGYKIFHSGDTRGEYIEELEAFNLIDEDIDLAFLHIDFFNKGANENPEEGYTKVQQYIAPEKIILTHNYPAYLNGGYDVVDALKDQTQNIFIFNNELQSIDIEYTPAQNNQIEQYIEFNEGWNLFSLYVEPASLSIDSIFSDIMQYIITIKDFDSSYVASRDDHLNTLKTLQFGHAYFINMENARSVSILGSVFSCAEYPAITLAEGWNLMGFPFIGEYAFPELFPEIRDKTLLLKNMETFYVPSSPFNTLQSLKQGEGYFIKLNSPGQIDCKTLE